MQAMTRILVIVVLLVAPCVALAQEEALQGDGEEPRLFFTDNRWTPDISTPGPDMGDYPNSAYTLPRGGVYIEQAPFTLQTANRAEPGEYSWPFLLRFGLTDDVEFRAFATGLASTLGSDGTTGFAPLALDLKVHLWNDRMEYLRPAASLEVFIQTTWGSRAFSGGTQPALNLNLDFPLSEATNIEMTFGYSGVQDPVEVIDASGQARITNLDINEFSYQWAWEQQVTERFQVFAHGYYNGPVLMQSGAGVVAGMGYFVQLSERWMIFNSYNAGLSSAAPPFATQFGFAVAL